MLIKKKLSILDIAKKSGGQYNSVNGYTSQRSGSIANYLLRLGVSKNHRLENSIAFADRLDPQAVADAMSVQYNVAIPVADVQRYITEQADSWRASQKAPQKPRIFTALATAKNGAPILSIKDNDPIDAIYIVGQLEHYKNIKKGTPKKDPVSDSAKVKAYVRNKSESGKYTQLKLKIGEDANFTNICINGKVYTPADVYSLVIQARKAVSQ